MSLFSMRRSSPGFMGAVCKGGSKHTRLDACAESALCGSSGWQPDARQQLVDVESLYC
jgi:hypothetical protein